jgi:hypothetical protein
MARPDSERYELTDAEKRDLINSGMTFLTTT